MFQPSACSFVLAVSLAGSICLLPADSFAQLNQDIMAAAHSYVENTVSTWRGDPAIVDAVNAQNAVKAKLVQADIDKLDVEWRVESKTGSGPMIDAVLGKALSTCHKGLQTVSVGLITDVFVMDDKGLNVGQSDVTSDYWQGDERKWQKTFQVGPKAVFVDEVELEESSQRYQTQVSVSVVDPATGKVIGAITIGVDAEGLMMM